jgi:hypothetical protein
MCRVRMFCRWQFALLVLRPFSAGCRGGSMGSPSSPSGFLTLFLAPNSAQVFQRQATSVTFNATLVESGTKDTRVRPCG